MENLNNLKTLEGKEFGAGRCAFRITTVSLWDQSRIYINTEKTGTAYKHVDGCFYYDIATKAPVIKITGTSKEIDACKAQIETLIKNLTNQPE